MRRALSLLALGMTLALTTAQTLVLTSIKAVDSTTANKDQWSVKGHFNDPDGEVVPAIGELGLTASLVNGNEEVVGEQDFEAGDCKVLRNGKGVICKVAGARMSLKRTKRVPKDAIIEAQKSKNTTSASSFFRVSGVFRRQEFNSTLLSPLAGAFVNDDLQVIDFNSQCTEKNGIKATKFLCKPGADTPAPTPAPTFSG
eukprot:evm.model.NODE_41432_length_12839_cov_26.576136.2